MLFPDVPIVVRGGGDLASGAIYRLHRAGFPVIVLELDKPLLVRRLACYGEAVFSDEITVGGITARRVDDANAIDDVLAAGDVPVLIDEDGSVLEALEPVVLLDARMEKQRLDTTMDAAPLVLALGPGFVAGADVHAVIETNRGHDLGRVIWEGGAEPDTGVPGSMRGKRYSRVLRAPTMASSRRQRASAIGCKKATRLPR